MIQSLKRDFSVTNTDAVVLTISPFNDGQNGFSFGVTPFNSQREGSVENGGGFGVSTAWDQVWYSATRRYNNCWVAEMAIPLNSIRFNPGRPIGDSMWLDLISRTMRFLAVLGCRETST